MKAMASTGAMWDYLDKMDKNLLYDYTAVLTGQKKRMQWFNRTEGEMTEDEQRRREAEERSNSLYLIWFVYRYILGCNTLEEALSYNAEEVLTKYRLKMLMEQKFLYLGIDRDIPLWKEEDIRIILTILYNRLDFWEQLDCFIQNAGTGNRINIRQKRCMEAKRRYEELLGKRNHNERNSR